MTDHADELTHAVIGVEPLLPGGENGEHEEGDE